MKIIVTGATGFVGRHLCSHLIASGHEVTAVVRRVGSAPQGAHEVHIEDISGETNWDGLLVGCDAIIHLAARVHVMDERASDPLHEFRRVNTDGTRQLAQAASAQGVGRFVLLSSIKVNGEATTGAPIDAFSPPHPIDPYGISKHEAEIATWEASNGAMEATVVRTPLVFGPGVGGNFLRLMKLVSARVPLPFRSLDNRRSVVSVWNLVDLLERAAREKDAAGALVVAGEIRSPSTADLLRAVSSAMGMRNLLFPVPVALITFGGRLLGKAPVVQRLVGSLEVVPGSSSNNWSWVPILGFEEGIKRTVRWFTQIEPERPDGPRRLKIAVVTQYYPPEPVPIAHAVAHGLADRGHEVRVVTAFPNYPDGRLMPGHRQRLGHVERDGDVLVKRVPIVVSHSNNMVGRVLNYLSFAASSFAAARFVRGADVVYVYATQMTAAIGPSWWYRLRRTPFVMHVQDLWPESVTGSSMIGGQGAQRVAAMVLDPWLRRLYRSAGGTIALGPSMGRLLEERGVPVDRLHTVFNWADEREEFLVRQTSELPPGANIMYAGNIGDMQDLDTVVRAAAQVLDLDGFKITIVGSGVAEPRVRRIANQIGATNVDFLGRVPHGSMGPHYRSSDFQLVTLKDLAIFRATIPSKLQSSLANGIPVVTTVAGDVAELVQANDIGLTSPPGDAERLAQTFRVAYAMTSSERKAMGERAKAFYERSMSKASGIEKIQDILVSVTENSARKKRDDRIVRR